MPKSNDSLHRTRETSTTTTTPLTRRRLSGKDCRSFRSGSLPAPACVPTPTANTSERRGRGSDAKEKVFDLSAPRHFVCRSQEGEMSIKRFLCQEGKTPASTSNLRARMIMPASCLVKDSGQGRAARGALFSPCKLDFFDLFRTRFHP